MSKIDHDSLIFRITKTQLFCTLPVYIKYFAISCGRFDQQVLGNQLILKPDVRGNYQFSTKSREGTGGYYASAPKLVAQLDPSKVPLEGTLRKTRMGLVFNLGDSVTQQQLVLKSVGEPFLNKFIKPLMTLAKLRKSGILKF